MVEYGKHQKVWGNQAAHGSASTDLAPAFSQIPLLELPRSVPSRVRVRTCSMRCAPHFGALLIRTDAYQGLYKVELTTLYRPYFLPEFLPSLEEWHLLGGDLDRIAGFGIAPFSGIAASGTKTAKTSQLDFVALPQSLGNTREQNADNGFGLSLGKVDFVGNSSSEFCFCHVSSPTEGTCPTWTRTPTICDDRDGCPRTCSGMSRLWGGTTLNA